MSFYLNLTLEVPSEASVTSYLLIFLWKFAALAPWTFGGEWHKTPKNTLVLYVTWVFTKRD